MALSAGSDKMRDRSAGASRRKFSANSELGEFSPTRGGSRSERDTQASTYRLLFVLRGWPLIASTVSEGPRNTNGIWNGPMPVVGSLVMYEGVIPWEGGGLRGLCMSSGGKKLVV